MADMNVTRNIQ